MRALDKAKISKSKRFEERFYLQLAKIPLFGAEEGGRVRRRRRDRGGVMKAYMQQVLGRGGPGVLCSG